MSALFILKPIDPEAGNWVPWYDKCFGVGLRASDEGEARTLASGYAGDEGEDVWMMDTETSCEPLGDEGEHGLIIHDFKSA